MSTLDISTDDFLTTPLTYPGNAPGQSVLLIDRTCLDLCPRSGRRLGQAEVTRADGTMDTLNAALLEANAAPVDQRTLVVSIGSNSSLAVMRRKFSKGRVSTTFPLVKGLLSGVAVGHSAHVSSPGYVAAAPFAMDGAKAEVYASLLDDEQLRCLDETEPNYERLLLSREDWELGLEMGQGREQRSGAEHPGKFHLFVSRHGVIARPDGAPVPLRTQIDLFRILVAECRPFGALFAGMDPEAVAHKLALDASLRDEVRLMLADEGWCAPSAISAPAQMHLKYAESESGWSGQSPAGRLTCRPSTDDIDRRGEQCVVLHPEDADNLGVRSHAAISGGPTTDRPAVVARVLISASQPCGSVAVDQVLRNGLGVEIHEYVAVAPAKAPATPVADFLIARPHYSLLRVQTADLATVEQDVALISPLAMSILGLERGDEVVLEGPPDDLGDVRQLRLKAHPAPDEAIDRRGDLSGGGLTTRFPSVRAALGVHPDLPWVFIDSAARSQLGIGRHKLAAVRVRAGRRYQLAREIRELLLLLVLAFVGVASVVKSPAILLCLLALVLGAALVVLRHRLKHRLESGHS